MHKLEKWDKKGKVSVFIDKTPVIRLRSITPTTTKDEVISINKYPLKNCRTLNITVFYHLKNKKYEFSIPKGFCFDGATIPPALWAVIGSNTDNKFATAALIHDWICQHHECIDYDRYLSTLIFDVCLECAGVNKVKRWLMKHAVDNWQKLQNWKCGSGVAQPHGLPSTVKNNSATGENKNA